MRIRIAETIAHISSIGRTVRFVIFGGCHFRGKHMTRSGGLMTKIPRSRKYRDQKTVSVHTGAHVKPEVVIFITFCTKIWGVHALFYGNMGFPRGFYRKSDLCPDVTSL